MNKILAAAMVSIGLLAGACGDDDGGSVRETGDSGSISGTGSGSESGTGHGPESGTGAE